MSRKANHRSGVRGRGRRGGGPGGRPARHVGAGGADRRVEQQSFTFDIHHPWNLAENQRYRFDSATKTHTLFVNSTDEPLQEGQPDRSAYRDALEAGVQDGVSTCGTATSTFRPAPTVPTSCRILRVKHPSGTPATDIMMRISSENGGTVRQYTGTAIKTGVYNKWWNLKVAHNASTGQIQVYADNKLVLTTKDRGSRPATSRTACTTTATVGPRRGSATCATGPAEPPDRLPVTRAGPARVTGWHTAGIFTKL